MVNMRNGKNKFHVNAIEAAKLYLKERQEYFLRHFNMRFTKIERDNILLNATVLFNIIIKKMEEYENEKRN